ncbi:hypothetical protein [Sphaerotilus sulfidivorans]
MSSATEKQPPEHTKEDALFKDFDATRARLQNFDLEAPVSIESTKPALSPTRRKPHGQP